ncbi:MAG: MBL fold metallo-hydrolase [Deltaproteobacteria bacterium]
MRHKIDRYVQLLEFPGFHYANCNCLLVEDDVRCMIETGCDESELTDLLREPPQLIVNSHGHGDHCRYTHAFPEARVLMHPADRAIVESAEGYLKEFNFDSLLTPQWSEIFLQAMCYRPIPGFEELEDGQEICTGNITFRVLHMPGHCAGHCCFFFPEQGFVFTSDIEFSEFGPWYGMVHSSVSDQLKSLDRLAAIGADYYISGHGTPFIRDPEGKRLQAYRTTVLDRQLRVARLLYNSHGTVEDIARELPIYRHLPRPEPIFWAYEMMMVLNHLHFLEEQGYAGHDGDTWYPTKNIGTAKLSL